MLGFIPVLITVKTMDEGDRQQLQRVSMAGDRIYQDVTNAPQLLTFGEGGCHLTQ
jgi:hypothetical protein